MTDSELILADFRRYFPHAPMALCLKECARLSALRVHDLKGPLLDVGCGDGLFAKIAFEGLKVWGIDINAQELHWATKSGAYERVILGDVTKEDLPEEHFSACVANCSLEHVPRLDLALTNIRRSLKPGGTFLTFVPNCKWTESLLSHRALCALGAQKTARKLQKRIDNFFVHHHQYDQTGWKNVVTTAGFELLSAEPVLSSANTAAFEMFLLPSLAGLVNKKLTTRWTNFPPLRRAAALPAYALAQAALKVGAPTLTAEFLIVAQRPLDS